MFRSVESLFRPSSVAIVGATDSGGGNYAKLIFENLRAAEFPARVYLINPRREELWGVPVYPDFAALPEPAELALVIIPPSGIPECLAQGVASGIKSSIIYANDFGEGGSPTGLARAEQIRALCDGNGDGDGLRVCGPNCMGTLSIRERLLFYPAARVRTLPAGPVGVVFQSGGTFQFWLQQGAIRGLGFSYAVSSGNELDLDLADYVSFMVDDPDTRLVACMVEGIRRPEVFMAAAEKALAAEKPILMMKIGRSVRGRVATQTHTGSLAGDDDVFDALCRKYGIIRCPTLDDMIETALAFQAGRLPKGPRIAMAGFSGGAKGMFLDFAEDEGAVLATLSPGTAAAIAERVDSTLPAESPLDIGAAAGRDPKNYTEICRLLIDDPGVDLLTLQGQLPVRPEDADMDRLIYPTITAINDKPILMLGRTGQNVTDEGRAFQDKAGVPFLQGVPEVVRALQGLVRYADALGRGVPGTPPQAGKAENLDGAAFEDLLLGHGLTPPAGAFAASPAEAAAAAGKVGFPVAVKIVSPQASHKTEIGGVALNLADNAAVEESARTMAARLTAHDASAEVSGYLVQEMVSGVEVIIGVRNDPLYGPFILVGIGGVTVEVWKDFSIRLLPVDEDEARAMLAELRGAPLLAAFRGRPARDVDAVARAIAGMSRLFLDHRSWLAELEVNPLIVLEAGLGVRAVDVRTVRNG